MKKTQAREMLEKVNDLVNLGAVGEEMTQHPMMGGMPMNIPNNFRGLAKVVKLRDESAKNWLGVDMPVFIDLQNGETNLLTPSGVAASVQDVMRVAHLEIWEPHP